jgi:hypothetical protein
MSSKTFGSILLCMLVSCHGNFTHTHEDAIIFSNPSETGFPANIAAVSTPVGYERLDAGHSAFAAWLRKIRVRRDNTVYLYNGKKKANQQAHFLVLDISVGNRDLQQCADAVIRMRAEYLFKQQKFDQLVFTDNAGTNYLFTPPYSRDNFDRYLQRVFGMCGTASLAKQMKTIPINELAAGDVLVRGGFPGHAAMVMDVAENQSGQRIYLLAQSYMPAQDIHILKNPSVEPASPWYFLDEGHIIETPEYHFRKTELKRW